MAQLETSDRLVITWGSTNRVSFRYFTDAETGESITTATVGFTLCTADGTPVAGGPSWPMVLELDTGYPGSYSGVLDETFCGTLTEGDDLYLAKFTGDAGPEQYLAVQKSVSVTVDAGS